MAPTGKRLEVPVVLIIFNRPEKSERVFRQIARQRPKQLFIVGDGPRDGHADDVPLVREARRVMDWVDWACDVTPILSDTNLGCRRRILSGLDQVFAHVPQAIIVEDDCLPHDDFFDFTSQLLTRYINEPRVFSIGGHIWEYPDETMWDSYTFSKYFSSWGWATWADRWHHVDADMSLWPSLQRTEFLREWADSPMESVYWEHMFEMVYSKCEPLTEAWDYAVQFSMWLNDMLAIRPCVNLVSNIGLDGSATHTRGDSPAVSGRLSRSIPQPLQHPMSIERDRGLDAHVNEVRVGGSFRDLVRRRFRGGSEQRARSRADTSLERPH